MWLCCSPFGKRPLVLKRTFYRVLPFQGIFLIRSTLSSTSIQPVRRCRNVCQLTSQKQSLKALLNVMIHLVRSMKTSVERARQPVDIGREILHMMSLCCPNYCCHICTLWYVRIRPNQDFQRVFLRKPWGWLSDIGWGSRDWGKGGGMLPRSYCPQLHIRYRISWPCKSDIRIDVHITRQ